MALPELEDWVSNLRKQIQDVFSRHFLSAPGYVPSRSEEELINALILELDTEDKDDRIHELREKVEDLEGVLSEIKACEECRLCEDHE